MLFFGNIAYLLAIAELQCIRQALSPEQQGIRCLMRVDKKGSCVVVDTIGFLTLQLIIPFYLALQDRLVVYRKLQHGLKRQTKRNIESAPSHLFLLPLLL